MKKSELIIILFSLVFIIIGAISPRPVQIIEPVDAFGSEIAVTLIPDANAREESNRIPRPATAGDDSFRNHGPAAPAAQYSWGGPNTAEDDRGNSLVLLPFLLPFNSLLVINADTGETGQFDIPPTGLDDYLRNYTLSRDGTRWYTTTGRVFREFDINRREWTFVGEIPFSSGGARGCRGWFEDKDGIVWMSFSPHGDLFSFDPVASEFTDHGKLSDEDWNQHPTIAMDDSGWIYAAIVFQLGNIVGYNPANGERRQIINKSDRRHAADHSIFRADNGKVYARLEPRADHPDYPGQWYELYRGEAVAVKEPKAERAFGINDKYHGGGWKPNLEFPDGRMLSAYSLIKKELEIEDPKTGTKRRVSFDYDLGNSGANIYSIIGFNGKIYGAGGTPILFFSFDPKTGETNQIGGLANHGGHINDMAIQNGHIYGNVYISGSLIQYDPALPWEDARISALCEYSVDSGAPIMSEDSNPRHLYGFGNAVELYGRPYALIAHPDGRHVIMGGNPFRALAGGGLLIYNTKNNEYMELPHEKVVPHQGTYSLVTLPNGDLAGGTTTAAGTTGRSLAKEAELYIMDWEKREVVFRTVPVPEARQVVDLVLAPNGMILGITGGRTEALFVFDPGTREVVHVERTEQYGFGSPAGGQAPRMMTLADDGMIYALFRGAIVRINPETYDLTCLAATPVTVGAGIVIHEGRLYFTDRVSGRGGPTLWSYELPPVK